MTEYDYSPEAAIEYQQKLTGIGRWSQEVSRHPPANPSAPRSDHSDSNFYEPSRSKLRSKSAHRRANSLGGRSASVYDGPDRPPTPPRSNTIGGGYAYGSGPYGQQTFSPQQGGTWQTNGGYASPPVSPYHGRHPQPSPQLPLIINNDTQKLLIPAFNQQTQSWEYRDQQPQAGSSRHRSSRKSKKSKRRESGPPGLSLGQMLPGVGYAFQGGSPPPLSSPGLYPYTSSPPGMSNMYLPSGHTSPASIQYPLPHSAQMSQTSPQAQQQQAAKTRCQQQQQQQLQAQRTASPPMLQRGMNGYGQPMMSPGMTTSYMGYPSSPTGYGNTSMMSGSTAQPWGTVIVESKRKEKDSGSSLFGRLTSGSRKKKR